MNLSITMDITNRCNSRCKMCYFSLPGFKPKGRDMSLEEFKLVTEKLQGHSGKLAISCEFEPLLNHAIDAILLECAKLSKTWQIRLNTNALLLSESLSKILIKSGIAEIYVSIDAPTQELNTKIRGNNLLPKILKELKTLADTKKQAGTKLPVCIIRSTVMRANLHELPRMIALTKDVGADRFAAKHIMPIDGCEWDGHPMSEQSCLLVPEETHDIFEQIREQGKSLGIGAELPPAAPKHESDLQVSCAYAKNGFHIFPDGSCYPCVWLTNAESYGNILRENLDTILNSAARMEFKNKFPHPSFQAKCLACLKDTQTVGLKEQNDARSRLEHAHSQQQDTERYTTTNVLKQLQKQSISSKWTAVALYGAGKHTRRLLNAWKHDRNYLPTITCILDDNASGTLEGIPIVRPSECGKHGPHAVIISSDAFEDKLYQQALKMNLGIPVIRMYTNNPANSTNAIPTLLEQIKALPSNWHTVGTFVSEALNAIVELTGNHPINCSVETGAGTSTLLLSHLSKRHIVFALDLGGSISAVKSSKLFKADGVQWIEGPSQETLPRYHFTEPLDFALIDGPHAYPFPDMEYYNIYPNLAPKALLVIDDIHIPTITNLFNFLKEEEMFTLERVVKTTAFFRRTDKFTFPTQYDGWPLQGFNRKHFPVGDNQRMKERLASDTQDEIRRWRAKETGIS